MKTKLVLVNAESFVLRIPNTMSDDDIQAILETIDHPGLGGSGWEEIDEKPRCMVRYLEIDLTEQFAN